MFSMGLDTFEVPMLLHKQNRDKLVSKMHEQGHVVGIVLLQGGVQECRYDTDTELIFRQESYFNYLFGVKEPGFYGAIDLESGQATLFAPRLDQAYEIFCGKRNSLEFYQSHYAVDSVKFVDELSGWMLQRAPCSLPEQEALCAPCDGDPNRKVYVLYGINTDSGCATCTTASFDGIEQMVSDRDTLHPVLAECRVFKSELELHLMRYVSWVTCSAHVDVMRGIKAGMTEYQLEAMFRHHIYTYGGCRHEAYTCICACGPDAATLHYGHAGAANSRVLLETDIALLDMGAEYHCYCSDITCSMPVAKTFSPDQKLVYEGVLNAVRAVMELLKPGCDWQECHRASWHQLLSQLVTAGVLVGDIAAMIDANLGAVFMPCGLGHFIGGDTHDVGGYLPGHPERPTINGMHKLRTARILEAGMVLTVEPGIYFIDSLLDNALKNDAQKGFIVEERLKDFRGFGGVRLEDVVAITADGFENFTVAPRTPNEVEAVRAGGVWPPADDEAPWLCRKWI